MRIPWKKMGRIYVPSGEGFFKTHAARPIPYKMSDDVLRLFFSSRDNDDRMLPTYVNLSIRDPSNLLEINERPLAALGEIGSFDDSGITLACILDHKETRFVYYTGWKRRRVNVAFDLSIGAFVWMQANGKFERLHRGPIMAQDKDHPFLVAGPFVIYDEDRFKMWYCSGTDWRIAGDNPEPIYTVFYAESDDGINWRPHNKPVIEYKYDGEVVSAPWVLKVKGKYCMWYSTRGHATKEAKNYAIGYAESVDGLSWERLDDLAGISHSVEGWDSEMICYPAIFGHEDKVYMFYSGNGVGRGGIGYAIADNFLA